MIKYQWMRIGEKNSWLHFYSSIATFNLIVVLTDTEAQQQSRFTREEFHNIWKRHLKITRHKTLIQNPHETCKKQDKKNNRDKHVRSYPL